MSDRGDDPTLPLARGAPIHAVLARAARACAEGAPAAMATVLARRGSTPATPGQKLLLCGDGDCLGTAGGGALEATVLRALRDACEAAREGSAEVRVHTFALTAGLGMCCGGSVDVLIESFAVTRAVGIVGAGHIAVALAPVLRALGFAVHVCDERESFADPARLPDATVHAGTWEALGPHVPRSGALLVMTHDHALDQDAIAWALREGYAFVGGVGSRAKAARTRARLEARDFPPADIARVRMPLGVSIGARSPEEIAVSIAAELVAWRRGHAIEVR